MRNISPIGLGVVLAGLILAPASAWTQTAAPAALAASAPQQRSVSDWLLRMHEASRRRAYVGTLVVSSGDNMSSARIWHVCDGSQQMERIESLTGAQRSTFRRNDEVMTFSPQSRVAVSEKRETLGMFPHLLTSADADIARYYGLRLLGRERVAGFEADVVELVPSDKWRFGYRIWSEKDSGLVLKLQTTDAQARVLEQVAFSDLQLNANVSMDQLRRMMSDTQGYKVESRETVKTTPEAEGWTLRRAVPGFRSVGCYRRPADTGASALQWVFSDGLASVSLFIEPDRQGRHDQEGLQIMGATHALSRRMPGRGGPWWVTLVGEVPTETLEAFARGLERTP